MANPKILLNENVEFHAIKPFYYLGYGTCEGKAWEITLRTSHDKQWQITSTTLQEQNPGIKGYLDSYSCNLSECLKLLEIFKPSSLEEFISLAEKETGLQRVKVEKIYREGTKLFLDPEKTILIAKCFKESGSCFYAKYDSFYSLEIPSHNWQRTKDKVLSFSSDTLEEAEVEALKLLQKYPPLLPKKKPSTKEIKKVTLKSGLIVGNLSSPHSFLFDDESVLLAVSGEESKRLLLHSKEIETQNKKGFIDIELSFELSKEVEKEINRITPFVDILIVPLPVMNSWKQAGFKIGKLRTCRIKDRATKIVYSNRFCI